MKTELRVSVIAELPDEARQQASTAQRILTAWTAFVEALKELPIEPALSIGPAKDQPVRRRRGRPRLHVAEPPSAA